MEEDARGGESTMLESLYFYCATARRHYIEAAIQLFLD